MAYSTGTASSMADLKTALVNACTANGWTSVGDVVHSGDCFVKLTTDASKITALVGLGQTGGTTITTPAPAGTYLLHPLGSGVLAFPVTYHIFAKAAEVYLVVNYNTNLYTHLGFGQSPITGMPGKGVWIAGTAYTTGTGSFGVPRGFRWASEGAFTASYSGTTNHGARTGFFIGESVDNASFSAGAYVHHGISAWSTFGNAAMPRTLGGIRGLHVNENPLTNWNNSATLIPIQPWIDRGANKTSLVADLVHARYVRIDNLEPNDTITLGPDTWRVYPVYKKDSSNRSPNVGVLHSGTYGYAFRV